MVHAELAVTKCEWRYHKTNEALREAKVKEYQVYELVHDHLMKQKNIVGVRQEAEISNEDCASVASLMGDLTFTAPGTGSAPRNRGSKRKAITPLPIELSPADKALHEARESYKDVAMQAQKQQKKMNKELTQVDDVKKKLASVSWGAGPLAYLEQCTKAQFEKEAELKKFIDEKGELVFTTVAEFNDAEKAIKAFALSISDGYTFYKKNVLADFARMKGEPSVADGKDGAVAVE